ncbi:MAG: hypothetical protein IT204_14180 [Fimbriimonadaceae bacterium]|nr:hypothetical protein [Fimbriimonadaceae bacterium]
MAARRRCAWLVSLVTLALAGCGGGWRLEPLVDGAGSGGSGGLESLDPLSFDETTFTGAAYSRDGTTRREAAIDAAQTGSKALNNAGLDLGSINKQSGLAALDKAIYIPSRQRAARTREADVELVDFTEDGFRVTGVIRYDDDGPIAERHDLRCVGPNTDLTMAITVTAAGIFTTQVTGQAEDDDGTIIRLLIVGEETYDQATENAYGRVREEYRTLAGAVVYASDMNYSGSYETDEWRVLGRDILYEPDGYWVAGDYDLWLNGEDLVALSLVCDASDGSRFTLTIDQFDNIFGDVYDSAGTLLFGYRSLSAVPVLNAPPDANAVVVDANGDPVVDDEGHTVFLDIDFLDAPGEP